MQLVFFFTITDVPLQVEVETGHDPPDILLPYSIIPYECTEESGNTRSVSNSNIAHILPYTGGVTLTMSHLLVALQTIGVVVLSFWI